MSDLAEEIGDITEEAGEVSESLEDDIRDALGVEFDVNLKSINKNHHQGTLVTFQFSPDETGFKEALNEVSNGKYEDIEFQNAGGVNLHLITSDDE